VKDGNDYYTAVISERQRYRVRVQYADEWRTLVGYTGTTLIRPGEVNRLTVIGRGSQFEFYINDQLAVQFPDNWLPSGKVGVVMGLLGASDEAVFEFDNFELRVP
jgi:hypothetical protein